LTKNWLIAVCVACTKKNIFVSTFFFWMSEVHISQAFWEHQACQIPIPYEPVVKFCSKLVFMFILLVFSKELVHTAMWLKLPKG
jgi:hypothetical protein